MSDTTRPVDEIEQDLRALPPDLLDGVVERNVRANRVALVHGYRLETLFGRFRALSGTFLLLGSGSGRTGPDGSTTIDVGMLLRAVEVGRPLPPGVLPEGFDTGVHRPSLVQVGPARTVVTSRGRRPAVFATENLDVAAAEFDNPIPVAWFFPAPQSGSSSPRVQVLAVATDGTPAGDAAFDWHLTVELVFAVPQG